MRAFLTGMSIPIFELVMAWTLIPTRSFCPLGRFTHNHYRHYQRHQFQQQRQQQQQHDRMSVRASSQPSTENCHDNNTMDQSDAYQRALQRPNYNSPTSWWSSRSTLPFACTSCGNCCRTKGSVWMSPDEVQRAAAFLTLSPEDFILTYATHTLSHDTRKQDDENNNSPWSTSWVHLQNDPTGTACVFLKQDDNTCQIYEARPTQCSTYPFWPDILESQNSWNEQVRIPHLDDEGTGEDGGGPYWTPQTGGCEGMQFIHNHAESPTTAASTCSSGCGTMAPCASPDPMGVPIDQVHEKLEAYKWDERRFPPRNAKPIPIPKTNRD